MNLVVADERNGLQLADWCMAEAEPWRALARCKGEPIETFFPPPSGPGAYDRARTFCASCPVKDECLDDALLHRLDDGFRGGLTAYQRGKVLRVRRRPAWQACARCGNRFHAPRTQLYCSDPCRNAVRAERMQRRRASRAIA